jgi:hypothetical protein
MKVLCVPSFILHASGGLLADPMFSRRKVPDEHPRPSKSTLNAEKGSDYPKMVPHRHMPDKSFH